MLKGKGDVSSLKDGGSDWQLKPVSTLLQLCSGKGYTLHGESHRLPGRFDYRLFQFLQKNAINNSLSSFVDKNKRANSTTVVNIFSISVTHHKLERVHSCVINVARQRSFSMQTKPCCSRTRTWPWDAWRTCLARATKDYSRLEKFQSPQSMCEIQGQKTHFVQRKVAETFIDICDCIKIRKF